MRVLVKKDFLLTRQDGSMVRYPVGEHDMPEDDASHWYTALHAEIASQAAVPQKTEKKAK